MTNPAGILVDGGHLFFAETATASTSSSLTENEQEIGFINRFLTLADAHSAEPSAPSRSAAIILIGALQNLFPGG